ncbi:hypothetical protein Cgig2_004651 [Carnegiea gigantea]|uniref:Uncharacterized protein n=1 Tax=Carnegiea gigantea TaxID=171969 RepID=A0A9Q1K5Q9_9CARY|nr:hypothetical protein Cgig2_004651 [Carnegiea gigantea]
MLLVKVTAMGPRNVKGCRMILKMLSLLLMSKASKEEGFLLQMSIQSANDEDADNLNSNNSRIPEWLDHDTVKAMIAECSNNSSSLGDVESEVFNELVYESASDQDKKYHRTVVFGLGVKRSQVFGVHGELRKRGFTASDGSTKEVTRLRAELAIMKSTVRLVEFPITFTSGTRNDDRATNSAETHDIDVASGGLGGDNDHR